MAPEKSWRMLQRRIFPAPYTQLGIRCLITILVLSLHELGISRIAGFKAHLLGLKKGLKITINIHLITKKLLLRIKHYLLILG
jgi:hypothetical protein